ncbi:MAG: hypothetical protein K0Q72_2136, partial [Armatimonadetes bacterium]|nr:hypothetical protein [Armatimonadota bacterium]
EIVFAPWGTLGKPYQTERPQGIRLVAPLR